MFGGPGCFAVHVLLLLMEAASKSVLTSCFCFFYHLFVIFAELLGSSSWGVEIGFGLHSKAFLLL